MIRMLGKKKFIFFIISAMGLFLIIVSNQLNFGSTKRLVSSNHRFLKEDHTVTIDFLDRGSPPSSPTNSPPSHKYDLSPPQLPGIFNFLPHLNGSTDLLLPQNKISMGKKGVTIVIGVPTIRRPIGIYVYDTVQSLISGMNQNEQDQSLIIVCITEVWNETFTAEVMQELQSRFSSSISKGLLEIITPKPEFYPDLNRLKPTLGDSQQRVKWRSKQNLDYAYLMMHAWTRGKYYVQVEDDIEATPGYITSMTTAATKSYGDWFLLGFSTLGFIGKLFKSEDIPKMIEFLLMFYTQKPCDWLMEDFLKVRMCGHADKWPKCLHKIQTAARPMKPSLFQHQGYLSSLEGTVNKLKDKHFGKNGTGLQMNPPVINIILTFKTYSKYDIYSAYDGNGFFWAQRLAEGDLIEFLFDPPIELSRIHIESGNKAHPLDLLTQTTVSVLPEELPGPSSFLYHKVIDQSVKNFHRQNSLALSQRLIDLPQLTSVAHKNTFVAIGEFDKDGKAILDVPKEVGKIWALRLQTSIVSDEWVLLSKIHLTER